jgi:glycosyltransferase involved in cell wall biosynthesis
VVRIAGDGNAAYLSSLRERYADLQVHWMGPLKSDDVLCLFSSAHFFVFPTRHFGEGQSNSLTEALACGCVPVASRHGFNASVVSDAGAVLELDALPAQYAEEVTNIWRTPGRWRGLSDVSRQRAASLFSTQAVIRRLIEHYRALVEQTPSGATSL